MVVDRATVATRPSSQSRKGRFPRPGNQRSSVSSQSSNGAIQGRRIERLPKSWPPPLGFKGPDRSGVVAFSDLRVRNPPNALPALTYPLQEEVSMISSCLIQGLLIAENAG